MTLDTALRLAQILLSGTIAALLWSNILRHRQNERRIERTKELLDLQWSAHLALSECVKAINDVVHTDLEQKIRAWDDARRAATRQDKPS